MTLPAGEAPQQKTVDRAESDLARTRAPKQARRAVERPTDLRSGKIGVDDQPGAVCDSFREPRRTPLLAQFCRPAVLPDDRIMDRTTGRALPQNRRLALVGDADRGDRAFCGGDHFTARRGDASPDLFGIVFD